MKEVFYNPLRNKYKAHREKDKCVFCTDRIHDYKIYEGKHWIVRANSYPFIDRAILIIPKKHVEYVHQMDPKYYRGVWKELAEIQQKLASAWRDHYLGDYGRSPHEKAVDDGEPSYNFYVNNGEYSGQSVRHLHWHFIPRVRSRRTVMELLDGNHLSESHAGFFKRLLWATILMLGGKVPEQEGFTKVKVLPEETAALFSKLMNE